MSDVAYIGQTISPKDNFQLWLKELLWSPLESCGTLCLACLCKKISFYTQSKASELRLWTDLAIVLRLISASIAKWKHLLQLYHRFGK